MDWDARLVRLVAGGISAAVGPRLSVLIFHRVLLAKDPLFPEIITAPEFDRLLGFLKQTWEIIGLDDAVQRASRGGLPPRALAITFDDGYADNAEVAVPILLRHGLNATFFIATGFLDGGRMWNDTVIEAMRIARGPTLDLTHQGFGELSVANLIDRRRAIDYLLPRIKYLEFGRRTALVDALCVQIGQPLPDNLMMQSDQVKQIRAKGMVVGAHTTMHPILAGLDEQAARREIFGSKEALEGILGEAVGLFAYPNGKPSVDYTHVHTTLVKEAGFTAAVSTGAGALTTDGDLFQIPRFSPWDRGHLKFGLRQCNNLLRAGNPVTHG